MDVLQVSMVAGPVVLMRLATVAGTVRTRHDASGLCDL
jgi:hypothetical protein